METDLGGGQLDLGRLRVAIAFADLAGYTRLTEEEGEEEAVSAVERFVEAVEAHPARRRPRHQDDRRRGHGRRLRSGGARGLGGRLPDARSSGRCRASGIHYGETIYRDGDYYGREVNLAARVAARSAGGEVIVTRPVVDAAGPAPRVRADRRGPAEGLLAPDGALHRASGR